MRKEILLAIIAGLTFGLVIAFGIWRANLALKPTRSPFAPKTSPSATPTTGFGITLTKPEKEAVLTENPTTVSGITKPGALVVISVPDKDYTLKAGKNGSFEQQVTLSSGLNEIIVTAFDESGESVETRLLVVYSSEFAKQ